jgi:hypothetical protein
MLPAGAHRTGDSTVSERTMSLLHPNPTPAPDQVAVDAAPAPSSEAPVAPANPGPT